MRITKGLIIADPWIGYILDGHKTWEMRSSGASHRGWFGLIRKGTGAVYGVTRLVDVGAPLSPAEMIGTIERHRIPEDMIRSGAVAKWNTPWKLADVRRLATPVPYRHRSGAVTWIELDPDVTDAIERQLQGGIAPAAASTPAQAASRGAVRQPDTAMRPAPAATPAGNSRFIGQVELTEGNIKNNHIYLRSFFDHFAALFAGCALRCRGPDREARRLFRALSRGFLESEREKG